MGAPTIWRKGKKTLAISLLVTSFGSVLGGKIYLYAAPPLQDKSCVFTFPHSSDTRPVLFQFDSSTALPFEQKGGSLNDASCLNKTPIYGLVQVRSAEDVRQALAFARQHKLKVAIAGQRHSMGGQSLIENGLVLDMRQFNKVTVDKTHRLLTTQTGATWAQIQAVLDPQGLSIQAMQSINIFTVGGALSVNAHGIAHNPGQVAPTIQALRIMLPDGSIVQASPTEHPDLFRHALGGYGLFGVILEADIRLTDNELYVSSVRYMDYHDFPHYYANSIDKNRQYGLFYARLSVAPNSYLKETAAHLYQRGATGITPIPPLQTTTQSWMKRLVINFSKTGPFGRWTRWTLEKYVEPKIHTCYQSRNSVMSQPEQCIVTRNQEMYDSMYYLKNRLPDTDILQEYFIPPDHFVSFVDGLRHIVQKNHANLLNVTIRIVHKDETTALPYAPGDRFALVLYFNQKLNAQESKILEKTTQELIDLALEQGGTFYLPYQLYYAPEQLHRAYPDIAQFFATKRRSDPEGLLSNSFYETFGQ